MSATRYRLCGKTPVVSISGDAPRSYNLQERLSYALKSQRRTLRLLLNTMIHVRRHSDPAAFLQRAEAWLLQAEAEHNLILGLARSLIRSTDGYEQPIYLASLEEGGEVVGCAFRTPPYKMGLTRMPAEALPVLVRDVAGVYESLPAVLGPEREGRAFAERWSAETGVSFRRGMDQRIYQLTSVTMPEPMPGGRLRPAEPEDEATMSEWMRSFSEDARIRVADPDHKAQDMTAEQRLFLWDDGRPVSMAGWSGRTVHGARIVYVYTPDAFRRHGYATAAVAVLSRQLLDSGLKMCYLYTDLSNPTSNAIYAKIGYAPVSDVVDYVFE
ncbi:MAG TPA: GNAT family N-acetyltransferase [Rhodothermales bacterium]|nr:GNAT family N-acetyltransferase [Rhodothermales bacterium]